MDWVVPAIVVVMSLIGFWLVILGVNSVIDHAPIWWAQFKSKWNDGHWFSESVTQAQDRTKQRRPDTSVTIALILAVAAVLCVWLMTYYDPYSVCIRANTEEGHSRPAALCTRWGPK